MNTKQRAVTFIAVLLLPLFAHAAADEASAGTSPLANALWGILPFIIIAVFIWFFFGRAVRKSQRRSDDYMAVQKQHNERVEQLLERIAKAVEKKGMDGG